MDDDAKIVTKPCKVDLHIHSAASILTKDAGNKELSACTKDELDVLISRLNKNGINVCSITDHDYFDYEAKRAKALCAKCSQALNSASHFNPIPLLTTAIATETKKVRMRKKELLSISLQFSTTETVTTS